MAGASMNDIKSRIKSVESTMQITKAMELVATSKLRRAKERAEACRPFHDAVSAAIGKLNSSSDAGSSVWTSGREAKRTLLVVIAGDRGLAGGYNSQVFKLAKEIAQNAGEVTYLPIGKKAVEYYKHRAYPIYLEDSCVADTGVGECYDLAKSIAKGYENAEFDKVVLIHTKFVSMLTQTPKEETLLPITCDGKCDKADFLFDSNPEELIAKLMPDYLAGILYSAVSESVASECGARRTAMNSANKNAGEMIDSLMLKFNRARQAVITQEITEIVSGAEAL